MNTKKRILAIDLGYSACKLAFLDAHGSLRFERILNCVSKLDTAPTEVDDNFAFRFLDEYYILGPMALKAPRETHIEVNDWESLKKVYPIWLSYLVKKYGGEDGFNAFDKIILGLSLGFSDKCDELLEYLNSILMIAPDRQDLFMVLPQGVAAKAAYQEYGLNIRETDLGSKADTKLKNYIILDIGQYTCDIAQIIGSKSSMTGSLGIENTGTIQISYKVVDYIFQNFNGLRISLKEAMSVVETGIFIRRRVKYNLQEVVDKFCKEYIRDILNLLEEKMSSALDVSEAVLVIGGGATIFSRLGNQPDVIREIENHFPKEFIMWPETDADMFNVYSYYLIGSKFLEGEV